jgi:outer membrane protein TolC
VDHAQPIYAALFTVIAATQCAAAHAESLDQAWAQALAQNHQLAASQMEVDATSQEIGAAAAERLPQLSMRGAYTMQSAEPTFIVRDPVLNLGTFDFPYAQRNAASAGAEVRLPLYTSGRIKNSILGAEARHAAARYDSDQSRLDLLYAVGEAYVAVLRAQRAVEVSQRELESLAAHAAVVAQRLSQQRAQRAELLEAEAAAAAAQNGRTQQQRALELARAQFNRLLARPMSSPVELQEANFAPLEMSFDQLVQIAYERRPDLQRLLAVSDSHQFASNSARAAVRPQVTASAGARYDENRFSQPQLLASAAVILDWRLFDGGASQYSADAEQNRAASARRLVDDAKAQVSIELLDAWNRAAKAVEQHDVTAQTLAYSTENLRVIRLRFEQGMATNSEVLQAQAHWSQAMRDSYDAQYDGLSAQLQLRYYAGLL